MNNNNLDVDAANILGEILWHTSTADTSIEQVSNDHMRDVLGYAERHLGIPRGRAPVRFLEVAAYAHITGYLLAQNFGWNATLSDISVETLALGAQQARQAGLDTDQVRRIAADFHDLPFSNGAFDVVYISAALHHTLRWQTVLQELMRVTAPGGILILQKEPCRRDFCFYKFPTNRPGTYREVESELDRQGILQTVAEPFPGSRPESLFGMIENQTMPLPEILHVLNSECMIESLSIDSRVCMSDFDRAILAAPRDVAELSAMVERELFERLHEARQRLTPTDRALGISFPVAAEVTEMATRVAQRVAAIPALDTQEYEIAIADLFGGAVTTVVQKKTDGRMTPHSCELRYANGSRKGVLIGYPPELAKVLDLAYDLVPDIQTAAASEILNHFQEEEWCLDRNADVRFLVLRDVSGTIRLRPLAAHGRFIVLLRVHANPTDAPFRLQLLANSSEIAGVDVHQPDSFLLRGELPASDVASVLTLRIGTLNRQLSEKVMPVSVAALRVVCIADSDD